MAKKITTPKIERRATSEINIVKNCRQCYEYKLKDITDRLVQILAREQVLVEKGKLSANDFERHEIAREIYKLRSELKQHQSNQAYFRETVDLFDQLIVVLDSLAMREQFKLIVRKIPEKKLPDLVRDMDKRDKLNDLLVGLIKILNEANQKAMIAKKQLDKQLATEQLENQIFEDRNKPDESAIENILAEFGTLTDSVVVETNNDVNAKNNKANANKN